MKIAMWTSWEARCGIASYTGALVTELERLGVNVDVVPVPYTERDPAQLRALVERLNAADLVHIQHEYTFFGGVAPGASSLPRLLGQIRPPRVVTAHTVFSAAELLRLPQEERWRQRLAKQILSALPSYRGLVERGPFRGARAVIVHTEAARERMIARSIPGERVHVIPAGVPRPLRPNPELAEQLRSRWGLSGARVLTIFGYVTPDKGYETALAAVRALPPGVRLLIAGGTRVEHERGYMDQLLETIRAQGLESRVRVTGYLEEEEIAAVMGLTDLVLVPHTAANGSYSVMYALSYGKPVLASDLACFRELHDQGAGVELFEAGDEQNLAERAGFLLASASSRAKLGTAASSFAEERSWARVAAKTRNIYEEVLAST